MKKAVLTLSIVALLTGILGADIRRDGDESALLKPPAKKFCVGYTIIEFGKAIDCNGDTVKLVKVKGVQTLIH